MFFGQADKILVDARSTFNSMYNQRQRHTQKDEDLRVITAHLALNAHLGYDSVIVRIQF